MSRGPIAHPGRAIANYHGASGGGRREVQQQQQQQQQQQGQRITPPIPLPSTNMIPLPPTPLMNMMNPVRQQHHHHETHPPGLAPPTLPVTTFIGASRKMQCSYDVNEGGREYHRIYDFDLSYETTWIDYVPLNCLFLALQHAEERFVAAFILLRQRDVISFFDRRTELPTVSRHDDGKYYIQLDFASPQPSSYGLPLFACFRETFTIRVIVAEKTGTNFFLRVEGLQYSDEERQRINHRDDMTFPPILFAGSQYPPVHARNGRMYCQPMFPWRPCFHGPRNVDKSRDRGGQQQQQQQKRQREATSHVTIHQSETPCAPSEYDPLALPASPFLDHGALNAAAPAAAAAAIDPLVASALALVTSGVTEYNPDTAAAPHVVDAPLPPRESSSSQEYDPTAISYGDDDDFLASGGGLFDK